MTKKIFSSRTRNSKLLGITNALEENGFITYAWDSPTSPIFDFIEKHKPDVFFINDEDYQKKDVQYAIQEFTEIKWVYCQCEAVANVVEPTLRLVLNDKLPVPTNAIRVPFLADPILYGKGKKEWRFLSDILYLSDNFDVADKKFLLTLNGLGFKFQLKIYGSVRVPSVYYLGQIHRHKYKDLLASAKIVLMADQEWYYNTLLNDSTPFLFHLLDKEDKGLWEASGYQECCDKIEYLLTSEKRSTQIEIESYDSITKQIIERILT